MRNWSKETLAKNIMLNVLYRVPSHIEEYNVEWLDAQFTGALLACKREISKKERELKEEKQLLRKWKQLYSEYQSNKKQFVRNYYSRARPSLIALGRKYPNTYGRLVYMLEKLMEDQS